MKNGNKVLGLVLFMTLVFSFYGASFAQEDEKVNINKATIEELASLKHIGEKYALRIIEFRKKNGPFANPEDIMKVKGIGEKIYEANKDLVVVE